MPLNLGPLGESENRFRQGFSELSRNWVVVKEHWLDSQCKKFEQERLSSIGPALARMTAAIHSFESVVRRADRELSDPDRVSEHAD